MCSETTGVFDIRRLDKQPSEGSLSSLENQLAVGDKLVEALQPLSGGAVVEGTSKLLKLIRREIRFLRGLLRNASDNSDVCSSSNLTHLKLVVKVLQRVWRPVAVLKKFHFSTSGHRTLQVDVVADGGATWIKVVARNVKALEAEWEMGKRSVLQQAQTHVLCADSNPHFFKSPRILFIFSNTLPPDPLRSALMDAGVDLADAANLGRLGKELQPVPDNDGTLNLDVTAMLAWVSALTNANSIPGPWRFKEPVLNDQAERERLHPVKPKLEGWFRGKRLICCASAERDFKAIIETLAGPSEMNRAHDLLHNRLASVVPDVVPQSLRELLAKTGGKKMKKARSLAVFGTGDYLKVATATANVGFVRAAAAQGIHLTTLILESRALTERKMAIPLLEGPPDPVPSYHNFYRQHLERNVPCVIRSPCNLLKGWNSIRDWVQEPGEPSIEALMEAFDDGESLPISNSLDQRCFQMSPSEYVRYWKDRKGQLLYLKDWHFARKHPGSKVYQVPPYFLSDWLNEYLDHTNQDDYKFVYVGPKGTWTPFHSDVFGSFSWSANVVGRKEWWLFPPGEEEKLVNIQDVESVLPKGEESEMQTFVLDGDKSIRYFRIVQQSQDLVFIPSGWWHQVRNLEDTISINHNWFNASNVVRVWTNMQSELLLVQRELSDCKSTCKTPDEWDDICQALLKANFGLNNQSMTDLCRFIANKRMSQLRRNSSDTEMSVGHIILDLKAAQHMLQLMKCSTVEMDQMLDSFSNLQSENCPLSMSFV